MKNYCQSYVSRQLYTFISKRCKRKVPIFGAGLLAGMFVRGVDHDRVSINHISS